MTLPINILIVDDEPKNLVVLESILNEPGYRLVKAESGEKALLELVEQEFALLILDIRMPGMTGFELANMIKQRKKTSRVPIIFLTAYYNEDQHLLEGYVSGAVDYLHKPVNATILRSKVAVFAELHRKQLEYAIVNATLLKEVQERRSAEEQLRLLNETLEQQVAERTKALRDNEWHFRQMINSSPTAIYTTDKNGYVTHFNPSAVELVGRTPELGTDRWCIASRLYQTDGEEIPQEACPLATALKTGQSKLFEEVLIERPDGERVWSVAYATAFTDECGERKGAVNVFIDISEFKRIEIELRDADRRKNEFLATLAHELRNPLAPIVTATSLMKDHVFDSRQISELSNIADRHLRQLIRLVDDLLDVARISRGRIELQKQTCCIQDVVLLSVESLSSAIEESNHKLNIALPPDPIYVCGDPARLNQIVANILNNSIKYTPPGGNIALSLTQSSDTVVLTIVDNGMGIPKERLQEVFDLFTQVDESNPSSYMGLGVGLALAKQLVEMHGGRIKITSGGINKGTQASIWLPTVSVLPLDSIEPTLPASSAMQSAERQVLVVDDLRGIRITLSKLIEKLGHKVQSACNGAEALKLLEEYQPDIVISDISMPIMDGYELASNIRAKYGNSIVLVAMTGYGLPGDVQKAIQGGFDYHMTKPPKVTLLRELFQSLELQSSEIGPATQH